MAADNKLNPSVLLESSAMFDINAFKIEVKDWIRLNPEGTEAELQDLCEELIPPALYSSHAWIIEQTLSWYRYILQNRKPSHAEVDPFDAD